MICYRDMSFCGSDCTLIGCERNKAQLPADTKGLPVAWIDFSKRCDLYRKPGATA